MITQVKMPLVAPENVRILPEFAYYLYGAWMDLLQPEQADALHESRSMNQYLTPCGKNSAILTVNLLNTEAENCLLPLLQKTRNYHLTKYNCTLTAGEPKIQIFGEDDLVKPYYSLPQVQKKVTLHLLTPTTFKTNNRYAVFPTPELILHSAATKWNALGLSVSVDDDEAIRQLMEHTIINGYRLSSAYFGLKDVHIQSFLGNVTLSVYGPEPMTRLFNMLMNGLRFTGLGIKTSLGMGGVTI
ncbi:CRISPR system precrRNA processing endoribonuclease RAMP protein Cas6 [Thermocaproicibacter melissae]|uniref:CRISPR system precrRNA processing endoribonuclease RAMP protein Cas6 n=1 Tax=Thermocaproicibacter melissae TaxID=2966552 RepID=UPI0024B183CD|nr:CRISPR system precrRNA processing endoribonuclease RAMP protein Cas6 [Thermocaproicibacter melissae]WBY65103.1 CRISPR system precrRNA processing endoribonuclease RAMP protein Cas6 [Thermocaproicibacter melissae]